MIAAQLPFIRNETTRRDAAAVETIVARLGELAGARSVTVDVHTALVCGDSFWIVAVVDGRELFGTGPDVVAATDDLWREYGRTQR